MHGLTVLVVVKFLCEGSIHVQRFYETACKEEMEDLIQSPRIRYLRNIPDYGLAKCFSSEYRWVTLSSGERVKQTVNCGCGENWAINYILLLIIKIAISSVVIG